MAIVEERCYTLKPEFGPADYFDAFEKLGRQAQLDTLGGLIGYYATEVGQLNTIVSLWRYDSFEDRQKRRSELAANPQWKEYLAQVRPMIGSMRNRLMTPVIEAA